MRDENASVGRRDPLGAGRGLLFALLLILGAAAVPAARVDSVTLANGNVLTGELMELNQGKLKYETDSLGTVYVEWDEITIVSGKGYYRVETAGGKFHLGSIEPASFGFNCA